MVPCCTIAGDPWLAVVEELPLAVVPLPVAPCGRPPTPPLGWLVWVLAFRFIPEPVVGCPPTFPKPDPELAPEPALPPLLCAPAVQATSAAERMTDNLVFI